MEDINRNTVKSGWGTKTLEEKHDLVKRYYPWMEFRAVEKEFALIFGLYKK